MRVPAPGPATTVATATARPAAMSSRTAGSSGKVAGETGSTKTSMVPPQVRPTAKASSSLIPYWCSCGVIVRTTSRATSYTAASTHPPDTLPATSPSADTAIAAPGGRGALR